MSSQKIKILHVPDISDELKNSNDIKIETVDETVVSDLKDQLEKIIDVKNINASNILQVARTGMELVSNVKNLSGTGKKQLLMKSINLVIDDVPISSDSQDLIKFIFNIVAPPVIDDLVSASKGDFKFKQSKKTFCPCIG